MNQSITDKYLSIPFKEGGKDFNGVYCYGLCQLFYRIEMGIILPEINKVWEISETIKKPEKYCVIAFSEIGSEIEDHVGIMLDDHRFLHISNNQKRSAPFPVIQKLTDRLWKLRAKNFYRIKKNAKVDHI